MKKCPSCGKKFDDPDTLYCEKCRISFIDSGVPVNKQKSLFNWFRGCLIIVFIFITIKILISIPYCITREKWMKQFEARMILKDIYNAELQYYKNEGNFSADLKEIGCEKKTTSEYYKFKIIHADEDGFVARAWGNIDKDDKIDIWEITEKGIMPTNEYDDVKNEGKAYKLSQIEKIHPLDKQPESRAIFKEIRYAEYRYFLKEWSFSSDMNEIALPPTLKPKYYKFKIIYADEDNFIARAWGNIDDDDKIDIWEYNEKKKRVPVCIYNDVENIGKDIDPLWIDETEIEDSKKTKPSTIYYSPLKKQPSAHKRCKDIYDAEIAYFKKEATYSDDFDELVLKVHLKPQYYRFRIIHADEDGFVVRGWGNIDDDDEIDIWEITEKSREPVCIYDDVVNEGEEIDPLKLR